MESELVPIKLGEITWDREVAEEVEISLVNRYFEQNPTNQKDQVALLVRPQLKRWLNIGDGPIRGVYSQPGSFNDALFIVSYSELFRVETDETVSQIGTGLFGVSLRAMVSMAATDEFLFAADGSILWLYAENGFATGVLTASATIANGDTIEIGGVYYQWTAGSVDTGTPAGTVGAPWLVDVGADNAESLDNMRLAINEAGTAGTTYSTALEAHGTVEAIASTSNSLTVKALTQGSAQNTLTTTETSANLAWNAATLEDGGAPSFTQVNVPDDLGVVSVGVIAGYTLVVIAQGYGANGRFYWIEPGETTIDPLNFATAERSPDPLWSVRVLGDQFWLFGTNTTEPWYPSGEGLAPFLRAQGRTFDNGIWGGTDVQLDDSLIVVDADGRVFEVTGGAPRRISNYAIEERIRKAMVAQREFNL